MMFEIMLRAWNKVKKRMEQVTGLRFNEAGYISEILVADTSDWGKGCIDSVLDPKDVKLLHWSGMMDDNGVPIREKDIVEISEYRNKGITFTEKDNERWTYRAVIEFENFEFVYYPHSSYSEPFKTLFENWSSDELDIKVIGNYYENPELLSEKIMEDQ